MRDLRGCIVPGARDDVARGRSLADMVPFFGSKGAAHRFAQLALGPYWAELANLAPAVRCVDVGGGEGVLAAAVLQQAASHGVVCEMLVLDVNERFLRTAIASGLQVQHGNTSLLPADAAELVLLRFVNHYQSAAEQYALAKDIARVLRPGGLLAAQIQTATAPVCALFDEVACWLSGDKEGTGRHWAPLEEFIEQFDTAGLRRVSVVGADVPDEAPIGTLAEEAWMRIHADTLQAHLCTGATAAVASLLDARRSFSKRALARALQMGLPESLVTYQPIVVMRRQ